jgi:reverse gyrase
MWSDDQIKQMPLASVVTAAMKDPKLWPRVAQLRPDADEILWRVAEREDTRAARLIKQIDMDRFKKAITKKGQILARLHTQTPEMVQLALSINPDYVKFVRNRTPAQHATILKLLKKNPDAIKIIHEPTAEQVQLKQGGEKARIAPTPLGLTILDFTLKNFPDLFAFDFTAAMETKLDKIAEGSEPWKKVLEDTWKSYKDRYESLKKLSGSNDISLSINII